MNFASLKALPLPSTTVHIPGNCRKLGIKDSQDNSGLRELEEACCGTFGSEQSQTAIQNGLFMACLYLVLKTSMDGGCTSLWQSVECLTVMMKIRSVWSSHFGEHSCLWRVWLHLLALSGVTELIESLAAQRSCGTYSRSHLGTALGNLLCMSLLELGLGQMDPKVLQTSAILGFRVNQTGPWNPPKNTC